MELTGTGMGTGVGVGVGVTGIGVGVGVTPGTGAGVGVTPGTGAGVGVTTPGTTPGIGGCRVDNAAQHDVSCWICPDAQARVGRGRKILKQCVTWLISAACHACGRSCILVSPHHEQIWNIQICYLVQPC